MVPVFRSYSSTMLEKYLEQATEIKQISTKFIFQDKILIPMFRLKTEHPSHSITISKSWSLVQTSERDLNLQCSEVFVLFNL